MFNTTQKTGETRVKDEIVSAMNTEEAKRIGRPYEAHVMRRWEERVRIVWDFGRTEYDWFAVGYQRIAFNGEPLGPKMVKIGKKFVVDKKGNLP